MNRLDEALIAPMLVLLWDWLTGKFFILKRLKLYNYWKGKCKGKKYYDYKRGCGYYIGASVLESNIVWETKMASGKTGIYELVDYTTFDDPKDMINYSYWNFLGYKGEKLIMDCTFKEFLKIYRNEDN